MKKLYCVICSKYRKFEKLKISYVLEKTLVLSIISSKCKNEDEKIFKAEEYQKFLVSLIIYKSIRKYKIIFEENMDQEFRLKKIDERRNYLIKEINQNELISKKHKKVCRVLNFIGDSLIAIFTITGCVSISIGIASSTIGF